MRLIVEKEIIEFVKKWSGTLPVLVSALTPDASLRRYFRALLPSGERLVVCVFDSLVCPEATGAEEIDSFTSFLALADFLAAHGVPVPRVLYADKEQHILFLEDLGDLSLSKFFGDKLQGEQLESCYREAIDIIVQIQHIPMERGFFPYKRRFTKEIYTREMSEFSDFVLEGKNVPKELGALFSLISLRLEKAPHSLAHRDFHAWNLMIDSSGRVRVIDFQDALLAPRCYDLVGLLNDRDSDSFLGKERHMSLRCYFKEKKGLDDSFDDEYDMMSLQRDFKVSGRFAKLVKSRGLMQYGRWIPGTLRRLSETLARRAEMDVEREIFASVLADLRCRLKDVD